MNDARTALRSLVIYAVCIPLALILGYLLANPLDLGSVAVYGTVAMIVSAPLLLRYHYSFMLVAWNMGALLFFMPGRMNIWIPAICLSFAISFTHHIMDKKVQFLSVPQLTRPLLALAVVVLATAQLRGGFDLQSFGGGAGGGKRYIYIFVSILGYFALTVRAIPLARSNLCIGLYFLGGLAPILGDLYEFLPSVFNFLFLFFPPSSTAANEMFGVTARHGGLMVGALSFFGYMMARFGIRNMLSPGRRYLFALMILGCTLGMFGGYRSLLINILLLFAIQFWLEGMFHTKWAGFFAMILVLMAVAVVPIANKLPMSMQRTLAFLPIEVDMQAKLDAETSSEWRLQMWRAAWPEVPQYLLLGKGYRITADEYAIMQNRAFAVVNPEDRGSYVAGDYHNGPLSVLMPLGLWGAIAILWLGTASFRVLRDNYRYGDPALRNINTFLLAFFMARVIAFLFVFGSIYSDLVQFCGVIGLSVALNGGVARPQPPGPALPPPTPATTGPGAPQAKPRRLIGVG